MTSFSESEARLCQNIFESALKEDLGTNGDVTSQALFDETDIGTVSLVAREDGVIAGMDSIEILAVLLGDKIQTRQKAKDGETIKGDVLSILEGPITELMIAERTLLNFIGRLSGIATMTSRFVDLVSDLPVEILDTRKTTPGWRALEKYAVRVGGGTNHRMGLYDRIMIKDNHIALMEKSRNESIDQILKRAKTYSNGRWPVQIEVDTLEQLETALLGNPEYILLDHFSNEQIKYAVAMRNRLCPDTLLEASGNVTLETVRAIAETGVDQISVGALTHSATCLDLAIDYHE